MQDNSAIAPCKEVTRLLASFEQLSQLDVAYAIEQAGGDAECVSPDYPPDDADQAVELAAPVLVAQVNATLGFLVEHGPAIALAFHTLDRLENRLYQVVDDTFGDYVDPAIHEGLRVAQRIRAAHALADQVFYAHPSVGDREQEPTLPQ